MHPFLFKGLFSKLQKLLFCKQRNSFHSYSEDKCIIFKCALSVINSLSSNMCTLNEPSQTQYVNMLKLKLFRYVIKVKNFTNVCQ